MRVLPRLAAGLAWSALAACQGGASTVPPAPPAASRTPTPTPFRLPAPAAAALTDADVGLPRTGGQDHLTEAQAAASAPDQVVALQEMNGWEWADAATRSWTVVDEIVLLALRAGGAHAAFSRWAEDAARAPFAAGPCPAAVTGLDECVLGEAGGRAIVAGRLDAEVFKLEAPATSAPALAVRQAARLRSG